MKIKLSFSWSYDPLGVISSMGKSIPYMHVARPEIEQFANRDEQIENTLQEIEEPVSSQTMLETPSNEWVGGKSEFPTA